MRFCIISLEVRSFLFPNFRDVRWIVWLMAISLFSSFLIISYEKLTNVPKPRELGYSAIKALKQATRAQSSCLNRSVALLQG